MPTPAPPTPPLLLHSSEYRATQAQTPRRSSRACWCSITSRMIGHGEEEQDEVWNKSRRAAATAGQTGPPRCSSAAGAWSISGTAGTDRRQGCRTFGSNSAFYLFFFIPAGCPRQAWCCCRTARTQHHAAAQKGGNRLGWLGTRLCKAVKCTRDLNINALQSFSERRFFWVGIVCCALPTQSYQERPHRTRCLAQNRRCHLKGGARRLHCTRDRIGGCPFRRVVKERFTTV